MLVFACGVMGVSGCDDKPSEQSGAHIRQITFRSGDAALRGNLYYPARYRPGERYPAIIVTGSWTTVKEQMAGLYAQKLADRGFLALAFDFRNFGESEGEPRFYESPVLKIEDIRSAVGHLETLPEVDAERIGAFAVCASAGYALEAAAGDPRIRAIVTTAAWLHDREAVKRFYGGTEGVAQRIAAAQDAKRRYAQTGEVVYVPTISATDASAAMYGPYDYYLDKDRGAVPQWSGEKFAVMSWEDWLTFDPMPSAGRLTTPILMIHSDGAVLPDYVRRYYDSIAAPQKQLYWIKSDVESPLEQFDYYDNPEKTELAANLAADWYRKHF